MKNRTKPLGIAGIAAVVTAALALTALTLAGCGDGGGTTDGGGTKPAITTAELPNGVVGTAYSQTLAATGDTPITWKIDSGSLPAGLSLAETTGIISGTPTTEGESDFTVKAINSTGSATKPLSITITASTSGSTKTLTGITVTPPTKIEYHIGDTLVTAGMVVTANYSDGTTAAVAEGDYTLSSFNSSTTGNKSITVTYQDKTAVFNVNVINPSLPTVETPVASPEAGTFTTAQSVTLTTATSGAAIYYTTDGSTPTKTSTLYSGAISISADATTTLQAVAVKDGMNDSDILTAVYVIRTLVSIAVTTDPTKTDYNIGDTTLNTAGMVVRATYSNGTTVTITNYTLSAFDSTTAGQKTITVTFQGKTATFTVTVNDPALQKVATPTASPAAGTYATAQSVTLATATSGAAIYYTTDGTDPTKTSTPYSTAISISATTTVKAIAFKDGMNNSDILTAAYTINAGGTDFVAVTNITGAPTTATVGTALTLTGTVEPATATNKTIVWSVTNGTGSATVSGSTLTPTGAGTVTVKATIANGTAQGTNYTKEFTITVNTAGGTDFVAVTNITGVPTTATVGTALTLTGTVEPATATNKTIVWSVVSGSATVSGSALTASAAGTVTVKATIANGTAQGTNYTKDFTITVSGIKPTITTETLPGGTVGTAYNQTLAATGDTPITWSLETGSALPGGLSLSTAGAITGTPTTADTFDFTVKAANAEGSETKQLSITINSIPVTFSEVTANGSATQTTTELTLTFSQAITGLSASDITLTGVAGVSKGTLSNTEATYTLPISGFAAGGELSVAVSKTGYDITDSSKTVTIYRYIDPNNLTSIAEFEAWLSAQPDNPPPAASYTVKLNVSNLGGYASSSGSAGNVLYTNINKYVNLDLSGSTFTSIGDYAFSYCTSLTGVTLPATVTTIGENAFNGSGLTSITIPNSVTSIGYGAVNCNNLTSISIPFIGDTKAGRNWDNLYFGYIFGLPSSVHNYIPVKTLIITGGSNYNAGSNFSIIPPSAFVNCIEITSITMSNVTQIYKNAFEGCTGLTSVSIGSGVTSIGQQAFSGCSEITSVTIPDSVTLIENQAFENCTRLTSVTFEKANTTILNDTSFPNGASLRSVYPAGGIGTYKLTGTTWAKQP